MGIFLPPQILGFLFGLSFLFASSGALPAVAFAVGLTTVVFVIATLPIILTALGRGRTWASYALWSVPIFYGARLLAAFLLGELVEPGLILSFALFYSVLSLLALFLPYRKFFPKK